MVIFLFSSLYYIIFDEYAVPFDFWLLDLKHFPSVSGIDCVFDQGI